MKDMQHYRDVSERVVPRASCREEILNKAERMQPKKRRPVMRRIGIGLAAASLALAGTTVAFGAANNWDYQQVFTKYFSEKNDEPVSYDFSKIGMNINESREFPEGTLTVESALVTPYAMYLSWRFLPNETVTVSDTDLLWGSAFAIGTDCVLHSSTADSYQSMDSAVLDEDGAYHFTRNLFSIDGTFTDNTLYLSVNVTQFHEDCSRGFVVDTGENPFVLKTGTAHEPEFRKVDVSVHPLKRNVVEYDGDCGRRQQNGLRVLGGILTQVEPTDFKAGNGQTGGETGNLSVPDGGKIDAFAHEIKQAVPRERRGLSDGAINDGGHFRGGRKFQRSGYRWDSGFRQPARHVVYGKRIGRENQLRLHIAPDLFGAGQIAGSE